MPKKLFLDLETSNFDYSHVFSSLWKWQGQISPNLTIWTQKWHISGKSRYSRNNFFGIMVPAFNLKHAVFEVKMSSLVKSDPPSLTGLKKPSWSQNFIYLTWKTKIWPQNHLSRRFGKILLSKQTKLKGVSSKPSRKMILGPEFCFSS